jgi:hypothetical protein
MENKAMHAAFEIEKKKMDDLDKEYFAKLQELSEKEARINEKLESQIYTEAMFIRYTQDKAVFLFKQYELDEAISHGKELQAQVDGLLLNDSEKGQVIEVLQRETEMFRSEISEAGNMRRAFEKRVSELESAITILVEEKSRLFDEKRNLESMGVLLRKDLDKASEMNRELQVTIVTRDGEIEHLREEKEIALNANSSLQRKAE